MTNSILFILSVLFYLAAVLTVYKLFGRTGLYVFTVFATILSNIQVCKCVDVFGLATTEGNELYAATFLVTDILSEKYGKKDAQRAVWIGLATTVMWLLGTQGLLAFVPNASDTVSEAMNNVFGLLPRVAMASFAAYAVSQSVDVLLYHAIWRKTGGGKKGLWIRNNAATLISQLIDTVLFTFLAFWGKYPTDVFISILLTTYLFKAIVAGLDTPFLYAARAMKVSEG